MKFVAKPLLPTENVARLFSFEKGWRPGAPIQIHSHSLLTKELIIEYRKTVLQRLYVAFISWPTATCNIFFLATVSFSHFSENHFCIQQKQETNGELLRSGEEAA